MQEYIPLNLSLMAHPANWFIITLMVLIGGFGLQLLMQTTQQPSSQQSK